MTVIGVTPENFTGLVIEVSPEVTVPLGLFRGKSLLNARTARVAVMGRLKPGISLEQARSRLQALWPAVREAATPDGLTAEQRAGFLRRTLQVESATTGISYLRESRSRPLAVLMALVGLVLLIVCVNLANLMLARAEARRQEIAIRIAVGVPATLAASRLVSGLVYGISEKDPASIVLTAAILAGVAICAAYLPARRAAHADPLAALRCN